MKHYMIGCVAATLLFAGSTHAQTAPKGQAAYACPVLHVPAKQVSDDMVKAVSDDLKVSHRAPSYRDTKPPG